MKKGKILGESLQGKFPAIARLAKYYEQELITSLKVLQGILLPMSILGMGVFVALIGVEDISQYLQALPQ